MMMITTMVTINRMVSYTNTSYKYVSKISYDIMFAHSYSELSRTCYSELTPYALQKSSVLRWLQKHDEDEDKSNPTWHCYALHKYRYWYWVLVSLEANIIGYWILGAFLGIVLTLLDILSFKPIQWQPQTSMATNHVTNDHGRHDGHSHDGHVLWHLWPHGWQWRPQQ